MKPIVLALVVLLVYPTPASADCGTERATVKLGLDSEARAVFIERPSDTTIAELSRMRRPRSVTEERSGHSEYAERVLWRVSATLTAYRLESDGDYHLVISDGHRTMIVEIPSTQCAAHSAWSAQIAKARAIAANRLHPSNRLRHVSIPVMVSGIGFFDRDHGQAGAARNGIELHPVLSVAFGAEQGRR